MTEVDQNDDVIDLGSIVNETCGLGVYFADTDGGQRNQIGLTED